MADKHYDSFPAEIVALKRDLAAAREQARTAEENSDVCEGALDIAMQREEAMLRLFDPDEKRVEEVLAIRGKCVSSSPLREQLAERDARIEKLAEMFDESSPCNDDCAFAAIASWVLPEDRKRVHEMRDLLREQLAAAREQARTAERKWQEYERDYILPCFRWAKEMGFDLEKLVHERAGKNCVVLFVEEIRSQLAARDAEVGSYRIALADIAEDCGPLKPYVANEAQGALAGVLAVAENALRAYSDRHPASPPTPTQDRSGREEADTCCGRPMTTNQERPGYMVCAVCGTHWPLAKQTAQPEPAPGVNSPILGGPVHISPPPDAKAAPERMTVARYLDGSTSLWADTIGSGWKEHYVRSDLHAAAIARAEALEKALRSLVDTLPRCDQHPDRPATRAWVRGAGRYCDECGLKHEPNPVHEYPRAQPLRNAIALLDPARTGPEKST
jgi:hypothetical protein